MARLYKSGLISDASLSASRLTPAQREAAETTARVTTESNRRVARRSDDAMTWLARARDVLPVGTAVARTTVVTAGNAAGFTTGEVNSAIADQIRGGRFDQQGTNLIRRF